VAGHIGLELPNPRESYIEAAEIRRGTATSNPCRHYLPAVHTSLVLLL